MTEFKTDENLKNLLKEACGPVAAPPELRARLHESLNELSADGGGFGTTSGRSKVTLSVVAAIAGGLICYGSWLSQSVIPNLLS